AFGGRDYGMHVFDTSTRRLLWKLKGRPAHYPFWFTSDRKQLVLGRGHALEWRDVATGKVKKVVPTNSHCSSGSNLKRAANGSYLLVSDFRRADGKPFLPHVPGFEGDVKLIYLSRVI